jgi:glutamate racemase
MQSNDSIYTVGSRNMNMVSCIEQHLPPAEIVERCGVADLARYFEANGCECFLLGCTHFPYLKSEIAKVTKLPIIDPADEMFEALLAGAEQDQE